MKATAYRNLKASTNYVNNCNNKLLATLQQPLMMKFIRHDRQ